MLILMPSALRNPGGVEFRILMKKRCSNKASRAWGGENTNFTDLDLRPH